MHWWLYPILKLWELVSFFVELLNHNSERLPNARLGKFPQHWIPTFRFLRLQETIPLHYIDSIWLPKLMKTRKRLTRIPTYGWRRRYTYAWKKKKTYQQKVISILFLCDSVLFVVLSRIFVQKSYTFWNATICWLPDLMVVIGIHLLSTPLHPRNKLSGRFSDHTPGF